jgi:hypothetical protein
MDASISLSSSSSCSFISTSLKEVDSRSTKAKAVGKDTKREALPTNTSTKRSKKGIAKEVNIKSIEKKTRARVNFSNVEDLFLTRAWICISDDPIDGTQQKGSTFREKVLTRFLRLCVKYGMHPVPNRKKEALQDRWRKSISPACMRFAGCMKMAKAVTRSGFTDADYESHAMALYKAGAKTKGDATFKFYNCWDLLRKDCPKFFDDEADAQIPREIGVETGSVETIDLVEATSTVARDEDDTEVAASAAGHSNSNPSASSANEEDGSLYDNNTETESEEKQSAACAPLRAGKNSKDKSVVSDVSSRINHINTVMGIQKMKPGYGTKKAKEILKKERKDQRSEAFLREHIAKTSLIMESSSEALQRMVEKQAQLVTVMQIHAKEAQLQRRNQEQEATYQLFLQNPRQQLTAQEYLDQIRVLQQVLRIFLNQTIGLEIIEWIIHVHTLWIFHGYGYPLGKPTNA